jgi:hypothetical protein
MRCGYLLCSYLCQPMCTPQNAGKSCLCMFSNTPPLVCITSCDWLNTTSSACMSCMNVLHQTLLLLHLQGQR